MDRISEISHALAAIGYDVDPVGAFNDATDTGVILRVLRDGQEFTVTVVETIRQARDRAAAARYDNAQRMAARGRCPDCGKQGERKGHQDCQFPS